MERRTASASAKRDIYQPSTATSVGWFVIPSVQVNGELEWVLGGAEERRYYERLMTRSREPPDLDQDAID